MVALLMLPPALVRHWKVTVLLAVTVTAAKRALLAVPSRIMTPALAALLVFCTAVTRAVAVKSPPASRWAKWNWSLLLRMPDPAPVTVQVSEGASEAVEPARLGALTSSPRHPAGSAANNWDCGMTAKPACPGRLQSSLAVAGPVFS